MKVYTKSGDDGTTALLGGERVSKSNPQIFSYGSLDELNSWIGLICSSAEEIKREKSNQDWADNLQKELQQIQSSLFVIGSHFACAKSMDRQALPKLSDQAEKSLEAAIDKMETTNTPLKNFILPGGSRIASELFIARTVARRAESLCVAHMEANQDKSLNPFIVYLNRLSDYLFVAGRYCNAKLGIDESIWKS